MRLAIVAAMVIASAGSAPALAQGDAEAGEQAFGRCAACHEVGGGAQHRVGPHLNDLFGRIAGSVTGYRYSDTMVAAGEDGLVWTEDTLAPYLADPRGDLPGNRMAFPGLRDEGEIADVLAYLRRFDE